MTIRLRLLDSIVEIRSEDPDADALLSALWATMTTDDPGEAARRYTVARDGKGGWVATAGSSVEAVHETLWGLTDALRYRMLELCEERLQGFVTLHAAAVARDGELVLLAGESGAGKTTLTLALLEDGWTYLSDDLAPVSAETGLVHPFPKPLGVKEASAWSELRTAFETTSLGAPGGAFLVPASRWDVATDALPVRALLFPRFSADSSLEVERLTPARAAAGASAYLRRLDPSRVALLNRLCRSATCAQLVYGTTADALVAIEDLLNRRE